MKVFRCDCDTHDDDCIIKQTIGTIEITHCKACYRCVSSFETCEHKNTMLVKDNDYGNRPNYTITRRQCLDCAELIGGKITNPSNFDTLPKSDVLKSKYAEAMQVKKEIELKRQLCAKIIEQEILEAKHNKDAIQDRLNQEDIDYQRDYKKAYYKYLASPEWREKRAKVHERDNHTCQSCLIAKSEEVHHLTYRNVGREPLFDLVAVCSNCHSDVIHLYGSNDNKCRINNKSDVIQKYK